MATATEEESFLLESVIRGHHVYKTNWTPVIGQVLQVHCEASNTHDPYAVATSRDGAVVGHLPLEFSGVAWHFLQHGGRIRCEVTGRRERSAVPRKGLVVPCIYTFLGKPALIKRLVKVMADKKPKIQ